MRAELLLIDPNNDFCEKGPIVENIPGEKITQLAPENNNLSHMPYQGSLYVPGADEDMIRVASMIKRVMWRLKDIHVTLDSHHLFDVAHPIFWMNSQGQNPGPFTIISADDVRNGIWRTTNPQFQIRGKEYVETLEANGRYPLCIWPPHCLIGSWGYMVVPELFDVLVDWEKQFAMVDYVTKGSNLWTEHYSAVQADVPDPSDPDTHLNMRIIETLQDADIILLAGEARSHCLANTVTDIADNFGEENIKKMILLEDATTDVGDPPGTTMFTDMGEAFVTNMKARGMQVSTTVDFLK